uniref:Uncharacterized protein n=1 Tax=Tanacetum cinerariifolium TaxID=118510 RepID=A0A6L2KHC1_TANCI|nr:hypothetical protein [Tanacetum cinerariifolium]
MGEGSAIPTDPQHTPLFYNHRPLNLKRLKNLESLRERTLRRKINEIDADEDITLVNDQDDAEMFDVNNLHGKEVFVEKEVVDKEVNDEVQKVVEEVVEDINTIKLIVNVTQVNVAGEVNVASIATTVNAAATITSEEITLAQALIEIKTSKHKAKGIVLQDLSESTTTTTKTISSKQSQDKAELQAKFDEEQRLTRERTQKELEANIDLIKTSDDVQVKIDADYQMAKRLQAEEQQELTNGEKATLFMQFSEKRRKFLAVKRAKEKKNKPPTQAQKRKIMCTYLKNTKGYTIKQLKLFEFDKIQEMFDKAFKRVNTFEDFRTELVQGQDKEKRAGEELIQESAKKQKVDHNKETTKLKELMKIIPDEEEVVVVAIPFVVKSPKIVDWKIHKERKKSYYQIIRADGNSKMYMVFNRMLKEFDREDLEDL